MNNRAERLKRMRNDPDWDKEDVDNARRIAVDIAESHSHYYIREDGQGMAKSTGAVLEINKGEEFISSGHRLLAEKRELLQYLGVDVKHIVSLRSALEKDKHMPERIEKAKKDAPVKDMLIDYRKHGKEFVKNEYQNPLIETINGQYGAIAEGDHVILATLDMLPVIKQIDQDKGRLFVDEGFERKPDERERKLTLSNLLSPWYNSNITPKEIVRRLQKIPDEHDMDTDMLDALEVWDDFCRWLIRYPKKSYRVEEGGKELYRIDYNEFFKGYDEDAMFGDGSGKHSNRLAMAKQFFKEITKKHPKYDYSISMLEMEIYHHINEGNMAMVDTLKDIERHAEFLIHFYESPDNSLIRVEGDGQALLQSRMNKGDHTVDWAKNQVVILDAESSGWMDEWANSYEIERDAIEKGIEGEKLQVDVRSNKRALRRDHVRNNADFYRDIVNTINRLHRKSDMMIGAVGYKDCEGDIDCPFLYYGDSEGNNDLKDCDIIFVLGSPRVPDVQLGLWYHDLYHTFPAPEPIVNGQELDDTDSRVGFHDDRLDMLHRAQVDRLIRDALGRGRTADLFIKVGVGGDKVDYDHENVSLSEMYGKLGLECGFDKLAVKNNQHHFGNRDNTIKTGDIITQTGISGTRDEVQEKLEKLGIDVRKGPLTRSLQNNEFIEKNGDEWSRKWEPRSFL